MALFWWTGGKFLDLATGETHGVPPVDPDPQPLPARLVGVYSGAPNENPDAATLAKYGSYPEIASTYYQPDKPDLNMAYETGRIGRGTAALITLTFNWGAVTIADVANQTVAAEARLTTYINALKTLSEINPDVPVYATIEHEAEVKLNQNKYSNMPVQPTTLEIARATSRFIQRCRVEAPLVKTMYWYGGADTTKIGAILNNLTANPHAIGIDPYRNANHSPTSPITATLGSKVTWLRSNGNYARLGSPEVTITETGTETGTYGHGDANNQAWWAELRECMAQFDIRFTVFFDRAGLPDWDVRLLSGRDPLALAAFSAEMAQ